MRLQDEHDNDLAILPLAGGNNLDLSGGRQAVDLVETQIIIKLIGRDKSETHFNVQNRQCGYPA
jgi:hypothetical protein